MPKQINAEIILGQLKKRKIERNKTKQKTHTLLKQFTTRGIAKNRYFDLNCDNPFSEKSMQSQEGSQDDDTLREFLGFESTNNEGTEFYHEPDDEQIVSKANENEKTENGLVIKNRPSKVNRENSSIHLI